jgi:hypothetical protein
LIVTKKRIREETTRVEFIDAVAMLCGALPNRHVAGERALFVDIVAVNSLFSTVKQRSIVNNVDYKKHLNRISVMDTKINAVLCAQKNNKKSQQTKTKPKPLLSLPHEVCDIPNQCYNLE